MNIAEMHVWFRQYAQQMGMQNVRGIMPEEIDVLINTSISDIVNQLVRKNIGLRNEKVLADIDKINQIDALRSLYKVVELDMSSSTPFMEFNSSDALTGKMSNKYDNDGVITNVSSTTIPSYLYLADFAINYKTTETGYTGTHGGAAPTDAYINHIVTKYFPVRLIDDAYFATTINDYILRNRIDSPILVIYNEDTFDLYIDKFVKHEHDNNDYYVLDNNFVPNKFRVSYIKAPAKVKYASDIEGTNVDCDLPESIHIDVLKYAVDLYNRSINGGSYTQRNQQQAINNESRPAAENY